MVEENINFKKRKFRVGHKKPVSLSSTNVDLKSKKIKILFQKGTQDKPNDKHSSYFLTLNEKLSSIFQHNDNIRRSAADSLLEITKDYPQIIYENLDRVLNVILTCWVDSDFQVRKSIYKMIIELFRMNNLNMLVPFSELLFMQIKGVLSHIRNDVRIDGLTFLNEYLFTEFGIYKDKFIKLQYLLGWSPLVCRIVLSNSCKTLNEIYTTLITIREITYQLLAKIEYKYDSEVYNIDFKDIKNVLTRISEALNNISQDIISKREQKYNDHISISGMNVTNQKKRTENSTLIRIKRSTIPNIPVFIPNEREYILSLLTSLVLDSIYCITKYGYKYIDDNNNIIKILNCFKKLQYEFNDIFVESNPNKFKTSLILIERLLTVKLSSSLIVSFQQEPKDELINEFICEYYQIFNKCLEFNKLETETLFDFNKSNIFDLIFCRGMEMVYLDFNRNKYTNDFFSPNKYIYLNLLLIILNIQIVEKKFKETKFSMNKIKGLDNLNIYNENHDKKKVLVEIKLTNEEVSINEIIQKMIVDVFIDSDIWINEKGKLTIHFFKIIIIIPVVINNICYSRNYFIENKVSEWSIFEHIFISIGSYYLNKNQSDKSTANEIEIAKFCISNIPRCIYILFSSSSSEKKTFPKSIIYNLLHILDDYLKGRMVSQIKDENLNNQISKGLMSFFVSTKSSSEEQINNIVLKLPYELQRLIISTIPYWPKIPDKFLKIVIEQLLILLKNESHLLFCFFIIQGILLNTNDSILSLEIKMSFIVTLIQNCECKFKVKFRIFSIISECLISLFDKYVYSNNEEIISHNLNHLFFKKWFLPLMEKMCVKPISKNTMINICIFFNSLISKVAPITEETLIIKSASTPVLNFEMPRLFQEIIFNSLIYSSEINFLNCESDHQNIKNIYETFIYDLEKYDDNKSEKHSIREELPIKILSYPIFCILTVWKSSIYLVEKLDSIQIESTKYISLNSTIEYISEIFTRDFDFKEDSSFLNLFNFFLISIWWLDLKKNQNFQTTKNLNLNLKQLENYFEKINLNFSRNIHQKLINIIKHKIYL